MGSGGIFEEKMFVSIRTSGEETDSEREIGCEIVVKVGVVEELFQEKINEDQFGCGKEEF
jgi:hypothetical protein